MDVNCNGDRAEWAEFRTVWKLYGAPTYSNQQEDKAWALKQCFKGDGWSELVLHVPIPYMQFIWM